MYFSINRPFNLEITKQLNKIIMKSCTERSWGGSAVNVELLPSSLQEMGNNQIIRYLQKMRLLSLANS